MHHEQEAFVETMDAKIQHHCTGEIIIVDELNLLEDSDGISYSLTNFLLR